jgi:hypothetical protein
MLSSAFGINRNEKLYETRKRLQARIKLKRFLLAKENN